MDQIVRVVADVLGVPRDPQLCGVPLLIARYLERYECRFSRTHTYDGTSYYCCPDARRHKLERLELAEFPIDAIEGATRITMNFGGTELARGLVSEDGVKFFETHMPAPALFPLLCGLQLVVKGENLPAHFSMWLIPSDATVSHEFSIRVTLAVAGGLCDAGSRIKADLGRVSQMCRRALADGKYSNVWQVCDGACMPKWSL